MNSDKLHDEIFLNGWEGRGVGDAVLLNFERAYPHPPPPSSFVILSLQTL